LVQFSLLPFDFGLLCLYAPLHFFILLLPSLHLIPDQRPTEESHGSADTSASTGVSRGTANDRAQPGSTQGANRSAFFSRRQRLRTAEENNRNDYRHVHEKLFHKDLLQLCSNDA
jgi:hypothetical protein